jgi:hypothetical protein
MKVLGECVISDSDMRTNKVARQNSAGARLVDVVDVVDFVDIH